jgi:hypothetical protein
MAGVYRSCLEKTEYANLYKTNKQLAERIGDGAKISTTMVDCGLGMEDSQ